MPSFDVERHCKIQRSARTVQVESMYDIPPSEQASLSWKVDLPIEDVEWSIGLICGPSGAGKTTIATRAFGDPLNQLEWSTQRAILDDFPPSMETREVLDALGAVGLSSTPSWLRPFHTLSNGEQFRASMARAISEAQPGRPLVIDEFTSVVDRQVAKIVSHGIQKAIRRRGLRFVAVSCHSDIIDWLQPDWVFFPAGNTFLRRSLQRHPDIRLDVYRIPRDSWRFFKHHHYMTGELHTGADCYGGFVGDKCVAFCSALPYPNREGRSIWKGHRLVVLPDWQGLGIGGRMDDWLGEFYAAQGRRYRNTVAHPAMRAYYLKSPKWRLLPSEGIRPLSKRKIRPAGSTRALAARQTNVRTRPGRDRQGHSPPPPSGRDAELLAGLAHRPSVRAL